MTTAPEGRTTESAASNVRLDPDASQTTSAPSGSQTANHLVERLTLRVDDVGRAECTRGLETGDVGVETDHDKWMRARERCHPGAQQADRTGPKHHDHVTRTNRHVHAHRVVRDRVRLSQTRQIERQRCRHVVQTARRHPHIVGHRAVHAVAESLAGRAEIVPAPPAHRARATDNGGRFADNAVALAEAADRAAGARDRAAELVAERHRHVHRPGMRAVRLVHVGATHRDRPHRKQDVVVSNVGTGTSRRATACGLMSN